VAISVVTIGNLSLDRIAKAEDYALAAAARPFLGQPGFTLIAVAALLSTGSAINATLYGAGRLSYVIAKEGELPEALEHKVWRRPIEGLLITAGLRLPDHLRGGECRRVPAAPAYPLQPPGGGGRGCCVRLGTRRPGLAATAGGSRGDHRPAGDAHRRLRDGDCVSALERQDATPVA
jgi:hypothetical protein